jgi:hypothetical protein
MKDHIDLDAATTASPEQVAALPDTSGWWVREQVRLGRMAQKLRLLAGSWFVGSSGNERGSTSVCASG